MLRHLAVNWLSAFRSNTLDVGGRVRTIVDRGEFTGWVYYVRVRSPMFAADTNCHSLSS